MDDEDDGESVASANDPVDNANNPWTAPTNDNDDASIDSYDAEPTQHTSSQPTPVDFNMTDSTPSEGEGRTSAVRTSTTDVIIDEEDRQPGDLTDFLKLHHQYGDISMRKLQEMAKQGTIPGRLSKCRIPTCSACLYSKATQKPWRGKTSKEGRAGEPARYPGHVVSVDQLVSPTPGRIAQITGFLTIKRYKNATVFVDQFTRLGFLYLQ